MASAGSWKVDGMLRGELIVRLAMGDGVSWPPFLEKPKARTSVQPAPLSVFWVHRTKTINWSSLLPIRAELK